MESTRLSKESCLLVIDVQERLLKAMPADDVPALIKATDTLIQLAAEAGARIIYTEQYPRGLGATEESLLQRLTEVEAVRVEKLTFDACEAPAFHEQLIEMPQRVVVCGMETHVCVWSTVRDLRARRHDVLVPFDAVLSRRQAFRDNGIDLMSRAGATIVNSETVVFDTLVSAENPSFKKFSRLIK